MPRPDETTFVLHGLDLDGRVVRARIFVQKINALIQALQLADRYVNGRPSFDFMLSNLEKGSASVTIREKQRRIERPLHSSIGMLETTTSAIYNGDRSIERLPLPLVDKVQKLSTGVAKRFSHAELAFHNNNVIRIDDYWIRQTNSAYQVLTAPKPEIKTGYYRGLAIGSFDGFLKEIDARGTVLRGKLVLTAGDMEIDCVMNKERVPEARECFDKRVVIEGSAHYDGISQLPTRLDVHSIRLAGEKADLLRWKGAFRKSAVSEDEEEDW